MFAFATQLFPRFFSKYDKVTDVNVNIGGFGTYERLMQNYGGYLDTEIVAQIDNLLTNIYGSKTMLAKLIPYMEDMMGIDFTLDPTTSTTMRRRVLRYIAQLYKHKGTVGNYVLLFKWIGITCVVTEHPANIGWDSPTTFDDDFRTFDSSSCNRCADYSLTLTGTGFTGLVDIMAEIVYFNEPIFARIRAVTFNGGGVAVTHPDYKTTFRYTFV